MDLIKVKQFEENDMETNEIKITKTNLAMRITCKCGIELDAEFMDTIAETHNNGGKIELINTDEEAIRLSKCTCV